MIVYHLSFIHNNLLNWVLSDNTLSNTAVNATQTTTSWAETILVVFIVFTMASIKQCPGTSEARTSRSNINKCPTLDNYHCLKTEDGQLRELCTRPIWIEAGKFKKKTILINVNFVFYRKLQPWFA